LAAEHDEQWHDGCRRGLAGEPGLTVVRESCQVPLRAFGRPPRKTLAGQQEGDLGRRHQQLGGNGGQLQRKKKAENLAKRPDA